MPRKQLGMVDDDLLGRVDARAAELGQTRRTFTERALEAALGGEGIASEPRPGTSPANGSAATRQIRSAAPSSPAPPRTPARSNVVTSPALQRFASGGGPARPKGGKR